MPTSSLCPCDRLSNTLLSSPLTHFPVLQHCGIDAFAKGKGSKVGEGIYLGTALSQVKDGKVRATVTYQGRPCLDFWRFYVPTEFEILPCMLDSRLIDHPMQVQQTFCHALFPCIRSIDSRVSRVIGSGFPQTTALMCVRYLSNISHSLPVMLYVFPSKPGARA